MPVLYRIRGRLNAMARGLEGWPGVAIEKRDDEVVTVPFATLHMLFAIRYRVLPVFEVKHQSFEAFDNILI